MTVRLDPPPTELLTTTVAQGDRDRRDCDQQDDTDNRISHQFARQFFKHRRRPGWIPNISIETATVTNFGWGQLRKVTLCLTLVRLVADLLQISVSRRRSAATASPSSTQTS